jgi:hypothetical protein
VGHPSASEFSQTEFPIKNTLDDSLMQQEMSCHCSGTREGKLLQKALKSRAQRYQRSSGPFFVAAEKITGLESSEPVLDDGQ